MVLSPIITAIAIIRSVVGLQMRASPDGEATKLSEHNAKSKLVCRRDILRPMG
jgi:hypothetical protein